MEQNNMPLFKSALLTKTMANHELLDKIGSAWILFFHLVLVTKGSMIGTYEKIGEEIGMTNSRTTCNWVKRLEKYEILQCQSKGKRVEIKLLEPHMSMAKAPDQPPEQVEVPEYLKDDKIQGILKICDGAKQMGSSIELRVLPNASK